MELQGRNLSLRMTGEDVTLLQEELRQLGFTIEDRESLFGSTTLLAVQEFQRQQGIEATGIVDEATARLINLRGRQAPKKPYPQRVLLASPRAKYPAS